MSNNDLLLLSKYEKEFEGIDYFSKQPEQQMPSFKKK